MKRRRLALRAACGVSLLAAVVSVPVLLHPSAASAQKAAEFESQREVRRVEIHGNEAFSDRKLRGVLRTRGGSFWRPWRHHAYRSDFVRFDRSTLQSYYRRRGYLSAQVDSAHVDPVPGEPSEVDVHFFVTEGPLSRLSEVRLAGLAPLSEDEVRRLLKQKPQQALDIALVEADRHAIEDRYADLGYAAVQVVDSLEVRDGTAAVVYRVSPGLLVRLGQVGVEGNRSTRRKIVTRELNVHSGDILAREKLIVSQQRIYDTGLYSDVLFERSDIDSVTSLADLLITVRERKMAWVDVGVGYGTPDQVRLTSEWGHRNIGHEGIRFVASGRLGFRIWEHVLEPEVGDRRVDATLSQPWILGTRTQASLGGYAEEIPPLAQAGTDLVLRTPLRAFGASLALRRDLSRRVRGVLAIEQRHVDSLTAQGKVGDSYSTRRLALAIERDTRDDLFDPKKGSDVVGNTELAGGVLAGSARFHKVSGSASAYSPGPRRITLAVRFRAGYVYPFGRRPVESDTTSLLSPELRQIPEEDRFFTGGATSVRGYFENEIGGFRAARVDTLGATVFGRRGGEVLLLGSIEARFPLFWIFSGAAFLDAGNVWDRPEDLSLERVFTVAGSGAGYLDMRYTVGTGIRIRTPVGPVRFDYGWKLRRAKREEPDLSSTRGTFHFSLGQAF